MVTKIIKDLKSTKATGWDQIPAEMLKPTSYVTSPLHLNFQLSDSSKFIKMLKSLKLYLSSKKGQSSYEEQLASKHITLYNNTNFSEGTIATLCSVMQRNHVAHCKSNHYSTVSYFVKISSLILKATSVDELARVTSLGLWMSG